MRKNKYLNNNLQNPKYFFHGSSKLLDKIEPKLSHDDNNNQDNIDRAIFVTPSFIIASAYAFKDQIKERSINLDWNFVICSEEKYPIMTMKNVKIKDDIYGYIYVFKNDGNFYNDPKETLQYKYFNNIIPIDVIKIKYKDFKKYYMIKN